MIRSDDDDDEESEALSSFVVNLGEATQMAHSLNLDLDSIPGGIAGWKKALRIEMEHGKQYSQTDITGNSVLLTAKIVLAHLKIDILYYERLGFTRKQAVWEASRYPGGKPKPIYKQLKISSANKWNRIRLRWTQRWAGLHAKLLEISKGRLSFKRAFPFAPGKPNPETEEEEEDMRWDWKEQYEGPGSEREFVKFVRTFDAGRVYALVWTIRVRQKTKLEMKMYQVWWFYLTLVAKAALGISIDSELTGKQASRVLLYDKEVFRKAAWKDVWLANLGWRAMPKGAAGFNRPTLDMKPMSGIWELDYQENYLVTTQVRTANRLGALWIAQDRAFRFDMKGIAHPVLRRRWVYFWYVIVSRLERLTGKPWIQFSAVDSLRALSTFERGLSNLKLRGIPKDVIGSRRDVNSVWHLLTSGKSEEEEEEEEEADMTVELLPSDEDEDSSSGGGDAGDVDMYGGSTQEWPDSFSDEKDEAEDGGSDEAEDDDIMVWLNLSPDKKHNQDTQLYDFSDDAEENQATQPLLSQSHWDPIEGKRKREKKKKGKQKTKEKKKKIKKPYANTRYVNGKPRDADKDAKMSHRMAAIFPVLLRGTDVIELTAKEFSTEGQCLWSPVTQDTGRNKWFSRPETNWSTVIAKAIGQNGRLLKIDPSKLVGLGYWDTESIQSMFGRVRMGGEIKWAEVMDKELKLQGLDSKEAFLAKYALWTSKQKSDPVWVMDAAMEGNFIFYDNVDYEEYLNVITEIIKPPFGVNADDHDEVYFRHVYGEKRENKSSIICPNELRTRLSDEDEDEEEPWISDYEEADDDEEDNQATPTISEKRYTSSSASMRIGGEITFWN